MTTATASTQSPPCTRRETASRIYWLHALSPLHVGSGRGVGFIDLPIMREAVTQWPFVPGSAVKGVYADECDAAPEKRKDCEDRSAAFGRQDNDANAGAEAQNNAGSLVFTDARLVALPVRSVYGTFAWCTSSLALRRLQRDLEMAGAAGERVPLDGELTPKDKPLRIRTTTGSVLKEGETSMVYLEDLDLAAMKDDPYADAWAKRIAGAAFTGEWQAEFVRRFAIVPNDVFDFLCERATEIQAHVRLNDDTKTVANGALWYEESLPAESLLVGFVTCDRVYGKSGKNGDASQPEELLEKFCPTTKDHCFQLGGKASVGKGRVRCRFQA